ncbi:hypothetical protein U879_11000 [Defluviimonas sp. 20V17]|uniref:Uncharacterized protein n=1 Tax=Allgaiera indica TaxID=765699 RepID=A0AAN4UMS3_9RHOB|nr:hypothetical protein [Allgaiera indica]KDB03668.1 hypothetical protein U879_11000 [Defluviimonas sp. 20V17]GHD98412.1 hypothetical protein GCM10008024_01820 [Allgaiera indica]SDW47845.1 hypothetical protein SAMN05444006_10432 [Allgaiera indica]
MSRHPIDHRTPSGGVRVMQFARLAREQGGEGSHPTIRALTRRAPDRAARDVRVAEYARIGRGRHV